MGGGNVFPSLFPHEELRDIAVDVRSYIVFCQKITYISDIPKQK